MPRPRMHPLAAAYFEDRPDFTEFLRSARPRTPLLDAFLTLREAMAGDCASDEALAAARSADYRSVPPDLAVVFLMHWANLSARSGNLQETRALVGHARALVGKGSPPELEAMILGQEVWGMAFDGDRAGAQKGHERILSFLPDSSPHRKVRLINYALFLSADGAGDRIEPELVRMEAKGDARDKCRVAIARFADCVQSGRIEEAVRLRSRIRRNPAVDRWYALSVRHHEVLLDLMQGRYSRGERLSQEDAYWGGPLLALLSGKPQEALLLAQPSAGDRYYLQNSGLPSFNLVRAELACAHAEAARRLVDMRRQRGNGGRWDDFFLARADLLDSDEASAAQRLAATLRMAERHGAQGRIEFELKLACEVSPGTLLQWARSAERAIRSAPPPEPDATERTSEALGPGRLLGASGAIGAARAEIRRLAASASPVLVTGQTGTGKELAALAIHEAGPRKDQPFVAINCAAIPETLLESELFGHEKGAFTGAHRAHRGVFEEAGRGTLFLDEIGDIPARLQGALLRVLEAGEIRPVGSARPRRVHCRIVAATNADLAVRVGEGRFRQDLWYRLNVLRVRMPSLRERRRDIPLLARHFLDAGRPPGSRSALSPELEKGMMAHAWPGNVRELKNEMERLRLLSSEKLSYGVGDFRPGGPAQPAAGPAEAVRGGPVDLKHLAQRGRLARLRELFRASGRLTRLEAMRVLGVSPNTATGDLRILVREGLIEPAGPNDSPRSRYFVLRKEHAS